MKSGVIILNKGEGISSQSAVLRVRRLLGAAKAGHTGTLDPLATGVLPILVNRAVKASEYITSEDKHYRATLLLGVETDTEDITGEVLARSENIPEEGEVLAAIEASVGRIKQIPPMYSAIKVGGRKLYELAREGQTVEREEREVTVFSIGVKRLCEREYSLEVHCSAGTYIRTLCADIGRRLGCGGTMKTLERTECAGYPIERALTLEQLEQMSEEQRWEQVLPTEELFSEYRRIQLPPFFARLARCGVEIYLKKLGVTASLGERVTLYDGETFFALGEVREFEEGEAIKPIKQFDI